MEYIIFFLILVMSITIHEAAHARAAILMGDPLPVYEQRDSLNPLNHLDIWGSVIIPAMFLVSGLKIPIAWARPVQLNPDNYHNRRRAMLIVGLAGPLANIILGLICYLLYRIFPQSWYLVYGILINSVLAGFNLLPLPPLDGSHIIKGFISPRVAEYYELAEPLFIPLLVIGIITGFVGRIIGPLINYLIEFL